MTEQEWQAANAVQGRAPVHNGLSAATTLKGIVRCGKCNRVMHVSAYGKHRQLRTYSCTAGCGATSMAVSKVEPAVLNMLDLAIATREPHVSAVMEGDTRYADALAAVEDAQQALTEYRDDIDIQRALGTADFAAGLRVRREAVEAARRALREVPRPDALSAVPLSREEADRDDRRRFYRRVIAEVRVFPRSEKHRLLLRWQGSDEAIPVPAFTAAAGSVPVV